LKSKAILISAQIIVLIYSAIFTLVLVTPQCSFILDPNFGSNENKQINFGTNDQDLPNYLPLLLDSKILTASKSENSFGYFIATSQRLPWGKQPRGSHTAQFNRFDKSGQLVASGI
jgi:hypothetical protein